MGSIISSRKKDNNIIVETVLNKEETTNLRGAYENIRLFSEDISHFKTKISSRGTKETTKYFLIPRNKRKELDMEEEVNCQIIDSPDKAIFVYIVKKKLYLQEKINNDVK